MSNVWGHFKRNSQNVYGFVGAKEYEKIKKHELTETASKRNIQEKKQKGKIYSKQ